MLNLKFLIGLVLCFLFVFLPLQNVDEWFYDKAFQIRGKIRRGSSPIVLVRINDSKLQETYESIDLQRIRHSAVRQPIRHSVWYQDFYNRLVEKLRSQNPRLVVFTSFYEWVDQIVFPPMENQKVIYSALLNEESQLIPPPPGLTQKGNYGFSNLFPDPDNVVRRSFLVYSSGTSIALRAHYELRTEPIERDLMEPIKIDFKGPSGTYPTIDAHQFLEADLASLKGKIVLVGREGQSRSDLTTPFGPMSRLEIHANILDTFLNGRDIVPLPQWVTYLLASATVVGCVAIILCLPLKAAWISLFALAAGIFLLNLILFSFLKIWIGISNPILCVFTTYLIMLGVILSRQEEQEWKLRQEAEYLKETDRFKNNFISLFSHDLKTPLAKIKAITARLLSDQSQMNNEVKDSLVSIHRTNGDLERTIGGILKVIKMEAMPVDLRKDVLDLNRLVEEATKKLRFLAEEKKIRLVLDLEPLFSMEGDQELLLEVIQNLVENAIKYSHENSKVIVRTREVQDTVVVSVIDEGPGIPQEELPRVTTKFYRGKEVDQSTQGTGLGLYLSNYFVELHKGHLEVLSQLGKGTEVRFALPIGV